MSLAATPYISPSQVGTAGKCDWAYEYSYRQRIKPPSKPVPLLTGSVLHNAREKWIVDHSLDMVELTRTAWRDLSMDTPLYRVVTAYEALCEKSRTLCADILAKRPDIKKVTATKDFKDSEVGKLVKQFEQNRWKLLKDDIHDWDSKSFTEVYDKTLNTADHYSTFYRDSLPALLAELKFQVQVGEHIVVGVIDDIRLVISTDGELIAYGIVDGKTYTQEPEPFKDFVQLAIYHIAAQSLLPVWLDDCGVEFNPDLPILCAIDMMNVCEFRWYQFDEAQLTLAKRLIDRYSLYRNTPETSLPNLKGKCDWCEWVSLCRDRIGMAPIPLETL